ncbi:MAG: beta-propeller domain-containing protein [Deltaproteobacteria bacterium]|nr:beta-propeller domain-containing protein [Deltaproteobacteria bacterium]
MGTTKKKNRLPRCSLLACATMATFAVFGCQDEGSGSCEQYGDGGSADCDTSKTECEACETCRCPELNPFESTDDTVDTDLAAIFPTLGSSEFETAIEVETGSVPGNRSVGSVDGGVSETNAAAADGAEAEEGAPSDPTTTSNDGPTAEREIIEADIVQMHGDILYVLNSFRGLVLIDMSEPDRPLIIGRLPFQAQPVEMYLEQQRAYIVMSDYFAYWQYDPDADPLGFHGSRVLIADVSDPSAPVEMGSLSVQGEITDSRIVGDVLYVVSKRNPEYWRYDVNDWQDTTWVSSLNIADPNNLFEVDEVEFTGSANVVQVYPTALSVAAIDPNYYLVDDDNSRQTLITYVDISDPQGDIRVGGSGYVPGSVADKFKMDLFEGHLRVISQDSYWRSDALPVLTVFDVADPNQLKQVSQIDIDHGVQSIYGSWIAATRYAGEKMLANICWGENISSRYRVVCRVDFYDLSSPSSPSKAGGVRIDAEITHFEPRDNRMLALGRQTAGTYQVIVGLYDISDLANASLISSTTVGADGSSSSSALNDYKAFKVLDELEMILLPLNWRVEVSSNRFEYHQGAQIIDWRDDTLTERGRIDHGSYVTRAIAFQQRLVAISERHLQVVDASDRDTPVTTADVYLVRDVMDVFDIGGYQVQFARDEKSGDIRFFVLPFGADDMAASLAELPVGGASHHRLRDGNFIHLISHDTGGQVVRTADFSDPLKPRWRGEYLLSEDIDHIYGSGWGFYDYYWSPSAGRPLNNKLLPVTMRVVRQSDSGRRYYQNYLRVIDLSDPDNPRLADGSLPMDDYPFVNRVGHGDILYSTHTEPAVDDDGNQKQYHVRYYLDRVDVSDPDDFVLLPKLNIPGVLVDVDESGMLLYTVDYQFDEFGRRRNSLDVLRVEDDKAVLVEVLAVGDEIGRARYTDRTVWLTSHKQPWWGLGEDSIDSRQPYTRLSKLVFAEDGTLQSDLGSDVHGYHFNLLDIEDDLAYLSSSYPYGLLILNVSDLNNPEILSSSRSIGYISKLVRHENFLYMPMGSYGVRRAQF